MQIILQINFKIAFSSYLEDSAAYFFTNLFSAASSLVAIIIGINRKSNKSNLKYVLIYPLTSLLQMMFHFVNDYMVNQPMSKITSMNTLSIYIFLLIEYLCISSFYKTTLSSSRLKKAINLTTICYLTTYIVVVIRNGTLSYPALDFFVFQALFILMTIAIYIYNLFHDIPSENLFHLPAFWVTVGALLYFLCTIPVYIVTNFTFDADGLISEMGIYSINFICYGIFFLLITRAFLCKVQEKQ